MIKNILLALIFPVLIHAQNTCNSYWQYAQNQNQIQGFLTVPHDPRSSEHLLKIVMSMSVKLPTSYVGDISLVKDKENTVKDIINGYSVQYRVRFPLQNQLPKLRAVFYNKQLLCSSQKDGVTYATTITLDHAIYSAAQQGIQNTPNNIQNTQSSIPIQLAIPRAPANSFANKYSEYNAQCGVPFQKISGATALVINGRPAQKGQFPWLTAYYHNGVRENGFICGGTLVSSKAVITAAHCIHGKHDRRRATEEALFYIGKFFISTLANEKDFIISPAQRFILHPDWNPLSESFDGDIAIVTLTRTIQFTNFIKPICIWTATDSYRDMVTFYGVIAGYGKTNIADIPSDRPYWTALPVVDEATCLNSNIEFRKISSRRTFCVGSRDGRGPCNGDSGGGFVVKYNNKWYLRGIISSSLQDKDLYTCDTKNYAVFTDIAAYKNWIIQYI